MMDGVVFFALQGIRFPGRQAVDVVAGEITWNKLKGLLLLG